MAELAKIGAAARATNQGYNTLYKQATDVQGLSPDAAAKLASTTYTQPKPVVPTPNITPVPTVPKPIGAPIPTATGGTISASVTPLITSTKPSTMPSSVTPATTTISPEAK